MKKIIRCILFYKAYILLALSLVVIILQKSKINDNSFNLNTKNNIIRERNELILYYENSTKFSNTIFNFRYDSFIFFDYNHTPVCLQKHLIDTLNIFIQLNMHDENSDRYLKYFINQEKEAFSLSKINLIIVCDKIEKFRYKIPNQFDKLNVLYVEEDQILKGFSSSCLIVLDNMTRVKYSFLLSPHTLFRTHYIFDKIII